VAAWPKTPQAVSQLTSVLASCTCTAAHGIAVGKSAQVTIAGASPAGYNGTFAAVATSTTAFQYAVPSVLGAASGTITATVFGTPLSVSALTSAAGTTVTATCAAPHGLPVGAVLNGAIAGCSGFTYVYNQPAITNITVISPTVFTYTLGATPSISPATGTITWQADIWVAKPWKLRCSRTTETGSDGTVYALAYAYGFSAGEDATLPSVASGLQTPECGNCQRSKTPSGGAAETEYVSPEWLQQDILYAAPAATTVQVNQSGNIFVLGLVAIGETRAWTSTS
jgi:hypothetical protein